MSRSDILNKFAEHTILPTPQRLEVATILLAKPQLLSAEQIIDQLRKNGSTVSKATVYNTLNLFGERGLVKELSVDPERRFYDSTTHAHHHFYNVDTRELVDIPDTEVALNAMPKLPDGTVADAVEILVKVRNRS